MLAAAYLGLNRYHNDHYGRVTLSRGRQLRYDAASLILFAAGLVGGSILDFWLDLPVSLFAAVFALTMLAWFAINLGLKAHHLTIWGALLVAGLLPVWGARPDRASVAWLPIGVATITAGIFDHRALVRTYGPAKAMDPENSNAGA